MTWGAQANGLPPQRRRKLRVLAARGLRLQRSGSVDVVFDMHPKLPDPADSIICQHLHTVWKIYHAFPESAQHLFWSSWIIALGALLKVRYRWQVVSGPLQALQAYLLDYEFDIHDGKQWKRTGYGGIPDCVLSLEDCWPVLLQKLTEEFKWQRLLRLTRYEGCHGLERPLDWAVSWRLQKTTSERTATALRTFHQGTLHGQQGTCPLCAKDLTFVHLVWECQYWKGRVKDLPEQWKERLAAGTEPELWNRGMVQSIFYQVETGMGSFEGTGYWHTQETLAFGTGHAFTIALAPTCQDVRRKRFCFAIAVHRIADRQMVASLTGVCPGKVSKHRGLFYALKHLALHVKEKTQVAIYDHQVWKHWTPRQAYENYPDLFTGLDCEDFEMVRPLLFARKELKENPLRRFLHHETTKVAKAAAARHTPAAILDLQANIDEDAEAILLAAAGRIEHLLTDKSHYFHKGGGQDSSKVPLIQQKKELLKELLSKPNQGGHSWIPFRTGTSCQHCKTRLHSKSLIQELRDALRTECVARPTQAVKRKTRMEVIEDMIQAQTEEVPGQHAIVLDRAYVRCRKCKGYVLARTSQENFEQWLNEPCVVGPIPDDQCHGHPSHRMERCGSKAFCTRCHARTKMKGNEPEITEKLRQRCQLASSSQDLRSFFS